MMEMRSPLPATKPAAQQVDRSPATGGGLSQGKFSYGYASSPGKRSSMEDYYETRVDGVDGETVGLFGVFDGHGGVRAAEYVKQNLFSNLINHPKFISDTKSAIADAYNHTDSEFLKSENCQNKDAGSTASTAILVGDRLVIANVGDSRAVICRGGKAMAVSRDHKPDQSDERQRIEDAGGFVIWAGTWRVGGVLAVSRAFGDRLLKQYVVADPEINEEVVDGSLEFLILASDGLWDVVTNEEAVAMIKPIGDPEEAAKKLLQEASVRGSVDNITCVVVRFLANEAEVNESSKSHSERQQCEQKECEKKLSEQKLSERKQSELKPSEQKQSEQKPSERKHSEQKLGEPKPSEQKLSQPKPSEQRPSEHKPNQPKLSEQKANQQTLTEQKQTGQNPSEQKAGQYKLTEQKASRQMASEERLNEQKQVASAVGSSRQLKSSRN